MNKLWGKFLRTAILAAREAGKIQMRQLGKVRSIQFKGEINLVTDVDQACEEAILKIIRKEYPDHGILTEDSGAFTKVSEYKWIIDPLDGTTNYAHGFPVFCVSIGLEHKGQVILGSVYEPTLDQMFVGIRGKGASLNGKKIRVSKGAPLNTALLATGFAYNVRTKTENNLRHFTNFIMTAQAIRRVGAAAVDLCYVACGRFDGFWELDLCPWDTAAGLLILKEAGGKVTRFDGTAYSIYDKEIVASNGIIHSEMVKVLQQGRQSV